MLTNSLIVKFLLKCVCIYLAFILLGGIPSVNEAIADLFIAINNARFRGLLPHTTVLFQHTKKSAFDTTIHVRYSNDKQWNFASYKLSSWYMLLVPNALFISLLISTTFDTTRKKIVAFTLGLLLNNIFASCIVFIRIYILKIEIQLSMNDFANTFFDKVIIYLHNNLAVYGWINFVLPVFAWVIVAFRKKMLPGTAVLPLVTHHLSPIIMNLKDEFE